MTSLPPRFAITPAQIEAVMRAFYARVRAHPVLGPIFAGHIGTQDAEWEAHIAKVGAFWKNAILHERGYEGFPMRVHLMAGDVMPGHFAQWLAAFDQTVAAELPADLAQAWSALAHRIGATFRMGVEDARRPMDQPPRLV